MQRTRSNRAARAFTSDHVNMNANVIANAQMSEGVVT